VYERYENTFIGYLKRMKAYSEGMSFRRFVEVICDIPDDVAEAHFRSQHCFFTDAWGNVLVDFVGRFEQLDQEFKSVSEKIGIRQELPHIRRGRSRRYKEFYTQGTARLIERRYEKDIELFNYRF
jgi:hypothetical protein